MKRSLSVKSLTVASCKVSDSTRKSQPKQEHIMCNLSLWSLKLQKNFRGGKWKKKWIISSDFYVNTNLFKPRLQSGLWTNNKDPGGQRLEQQNPDNTMVMTFKEKCVTSMLFWPLTFLLLLQVIKVWKQKLLACQPEDNIDVVVNVKCVFQVLIWRIRAPAVRLLAHSSAAVSLCSSESLKKKSQWVETSFFKMLPLKLNIKLKKTGI